MLSLHVSNRRREQASLHAHQSSSNGNTSKFPKRVQELLQFTIKTPIQVPQQDLEDTGYLSSQFGVSIPISYTVEENNPPDVVMYSAIEANNASECIILPINFRDETQVSAYFILYFDIMAAYRILEDTRTVSIFIEGQLMNTTRLPGIGRGEVIVSIYPVKVEGGTANLTISPPERTTSPALLNAIELFSVIDVSKVARSSDLVLGTSFGLVPFAWLFYYCMVWYYRI
ncbi:Malectin-like carbohydrate-binding domain containing protein [Parasponia andersonii]|uniref:Malectin-like carbohydrate-binding domain containing protein n=1 Tax=Parasponia andersonii TaxID=3476 RepID=A0A2P5D135_PARAD|nr:Malectin-like carbohydrate-binding domain containing protein [Parasponia andersonii]